MRWIFFVLAGANVLLLVWQLLIGPHHDPSAAPVTARQVPSDVPPILLLKERVAGQSQSAEQAADVETAGSRGPTSIDAPVQPMCTYVGPFDSQEQAAQMEERLAAMDVTGRITDVEIPAGPGYWVYLAPLESRKEALRSLQELQSRGVDSYIIPKGELANGISLGMFSQEALARARVAELSELGLNPEIDVIERSYKEIWVAIPQAVAANLAEPAWQRLLENNKNANRRQNFCLHVASQDNFH